MTGPPQHPTLLVATKLIRKVHVFLANLLAGQMLASKQLFSLRALWSCGLYYNFKGPLSIVVHF